jgi:hypothetical protein
MVRILRVGAIPVERVASVLEAVGLRVEAPTTP